VKKDYGDAYDPNFRKKQWRKGGVPENKNMAPAVHRQKNERGDFAAQAADILTKKKIGKDTDAYKAYSVGKLPPAHIHARATRYAVKLLLAHLHEVMYVQHHGRQPPLPYAIGILGHAHKISPVS
jgi:hypothetical protein